MQQWWKMPLYSIHIHYFAEVLPCLFCRGIFKVAVALIFTAVLQIFTCGGREVGACGKDEVLLQPDGSILSGGTLYWVYLQIFCGLGWGFCGQVWFHQQLDNQSEKHSAWVITASMQWRVSFSHYSMSVSHSITNVSECTSVVVKPKYCCRVEGESLFSAAIDQFQW